MADSKVWFITGCSKGFGRIWAEAALERGDKVAATARDESTLAPLTEKYGDSVLTMALDVQDHDADFAAVKAAHEKFGRLDIVVNNAGYGLFGAVEELSEAEARDQIETNLFGALWVTQAALPIMREQGSGHIIQVSSIGGVTAFPEVGLYHASKWGLEAFSQSLSLEVADFGINVTLIEPQGYSTDWSGPSSIRADQMDAYEGMREARKKQLGARKVGDPDASGPAILKLVDAEKPPLRCFFGANAFGMVRPDYESRIANWEEWDWLAKEAHGPTE
jgi:NAD(P)-dependent dehydrogenase (short-subunit alcohol dehydrogenase family)